VHHVARPATVDLDLSQRAQALANSPTPLQSPWPFASAAQHQARSGGVEEHQVLRIAVAVGKGRAMQALLDAGLSAEQLDLYRWSVDVQPSDTGLNQQGGTLLHTEPLVA
jgi:hypothetical protein